MRFPIPLTLVVIAIFSLPAKATVINVPGDYAAIQDAIDASVNNDTVLVANGTYIENIDFDGKAILLSSQNGPENTAIHIQTSGIPVVTISSGEGPGSILSGFTIEGDSSYWGIYLSGTSPIIYNNIIKKHEVGISVDNGGSPSIRKNEITLCSHSVHAPRNGGGIRMIQVTNAVVDSNEIHDNYSDVASAIYLYQCSNITVERNLIYSNSSIYIGGLEISSCSDIEVYNNTFVDNTSSSSQYILGSINASNSNNITVINNISAFNNEYGICNYQDNTNLATGYNDIYNNSPANYYNWSPGTGSIETDPLFADVLNNNFYLDAGSPCINAGDPAGPYDPDGTISDMGALYYYLGPPTYGSLAGTVSDTSGYPIENAHIAFLGWGYEDWTDVNGDYFVDSIPTWVDYDVIYTHPDFADTVAYNVVINPNDTTIIDIIMNYPGSISGTVTNSSGPIEGVFVQELVAGVNDHTDINGEYDLDGLNPGFYDLSFSHPLHIDTTIINVPVLSGQNTVVDIIMQDSVEYDILLMYGTTDGTPIPAVVGSRLYIDVYIQTGSDIYIDYFNIALGLEDQYFDSLLSEDEGQIHHVLPQWDDVFFRQPIGSPPNPTGWSAETAVGYRELFEPLNSPRLNCTTPTKILTFVVRIPNDPSLIGNTIQCLGPGIGQFSVATEFADSMGMPIDDFAEYFAPILFLNPAQYSGSLQGIVTNGSQQPIAGAEVLVEGTGFSDLTDGNGAFLIDNIVMGTYNVSFSHTSYCDTILTGISIADDDTTSVNVVMGNGGNISGTVTDAVQAPIESVIVSVEGTGVVDTTDTVGEYMLTGVCPGLYDISFNHPDYVEFIESSVTVASESTTTLNVILWPLLSNDAVIWYGSPFGSPTNAFIGDTLDIGVYIQTASDIQIEFIHLALGSQDQYLTDLLSPSLGRVHDVLLQWDDTAFLPPDGSPPNPAGWSNQSLLGINDIGGPPNPYLNCSVPTKIATFVMEVVDNPSLSGDTLQCLGPGINTPNLDTKLGDSSGVLITDFVEYFNPLYFVDPALLGGVAGTVADSDQNPIEGVIVTVQGTEVSDTTDGGGQYSCGNIVPGTYSLSFYHPDYLPLTVDNLEIIASQISVVDVTLYEASGNCVYITGDVNNSGAYDGLDIIYGVNFFKGGSAPLNPCECTPGNVWYVTGDVNNSCDYNGLDITYGVAYFKGGNNPLPCADCPPVELSIIRKSEIEVNK